MKNGLSLLYIWKSWGQRCVFDLPLASTTHATWYYFHFKPNILTALTVFFIVVLGCNSMGGLLVEYSCCVMGWVPAAILFPTGWKYTRKLPGSDWSNSRNWILVNFNLGYHWEIPKIYNSRWTLNLTSLPLATKRSLNWDEN